MLSGMYAAATAADAAEQNQFIVAHNLSPVNTTGYRRQMITFESLLPQDVTDSAGRFHGSSTSNMSIDFSPGKFQQTERSLDFVIDGDGFFELETANGPRYTRNGAFFVGEKNQLVTSNGTPVVGKNGPVRIPPNATPDQIHVTLQGRLMINGQPTDQIKIVAFEDNQKLEMDGNVTFKATDDAVEITKPDALIRQGFQEQSNVSATHELIKLMTGVRHHEAAQRALRSMAESLQQRTRDN